MGAASLTPFLYNISLDAIDRFRKQIRLVSLLLEENRKLRVDPEAIKNVINACIQEKPTSSFGFTLHDIGAYPEPPICQRITWRIQKPWARYSEEDAEKLKRIKTMATQSSKEETEQEKRRRESSEFMNLLFPRKIPRNNRTEQV